MSMVCLLMTTYLMTVGSATKYGKGLQKFSQMGEAMGKYKLGRPAGKKAQDELDRADTY
jgi:hypothetical protein